MRLSENRLLQLYEGCAIDDHKAACKADSVSPEETSLQSWNMSRIICADVFRLFITNHAVIYSIHALVNFVAYRHYGHTPC